jgi:hypothetical protein
VATDTFTKFAWSNLCGQMRAFTRAAIAQTLKVNWRLKGCLVPVLDCWPFWVRSALRYALLDSPMADVYPARGRLTCTASTSTILLTA